MSAGSGVTPPDLAASNWTDDGAQPSLRCSEKIRRLWKNERSEERDEEEWRFFGEAGGRN